MKSIFRKMANLVDTRGAALILLLIGSFIIGSGFNYLYAGSEDFSFRQFAMDLYANGGAELLSIAITVLIIENLNSRRAERERKEELIFQLAGDEALHTKAAARMLRHKGWLYDGSLKGAGLFDANLEGINLEGANLEGVHLSNANLQGANLKNVRLQEAILFRANLQGANLEGANLVNANLVNANLVDANLQRANLKGVALSEAPLIGVTLPDETKWSEETDMGSFTNPEHPEFENIKKKWAWMTLEPLS